MSLARKTMNAAIWSSIGTWAQALISLIGLAIIARILGPEAFGLTAAAWIVIGLGEVLISSTMGENLIYLEKPEQGHQDAIFWFLLPVAVLLTLGLTLGRGHFADLMAMPELAEILPATALLLPLAALCVVPESILLKSLDFRRLTIAGNIAQIIATVTGVLSALAGVGIWSLVVIPLIAAGGRFLLMSFFTGWVPRFTMRRGHYRDIFIFSGPMIGLRLVEFADKAVPRFFIGRLLGQEALGLFSLAWRLVETAMDAFQRPVVRIGMPAVAGMRHDPPLLRSMLNQGNRLSALVGAPVMLGLGAVGPLAVPLMFGEQWMMSGLLLQIMVLLGLRRGLSPFNGSVLRGTGRPAEHLAITGVGLTASIVLVPLAVPWGLFAVVAAVAAKDFLQLPLGAWRVKRAVGALAWDQVRMSGPPTLAALGMALSIGLLLRVVGWTETWGLAVLILLGISLYCGLLRLLLPRLVQGVISAVIAVGVGDRDGAKLLLLAAWKPDR